MKPLQFFKVFETLVDTQPQWNTNIKKCEHLCYEDSVQIYTALIQMPTRFLNDRVFIDAKYTFAEPAKQEYMGITSSQGNEKLMEEYKSTHDISNVTFAYCTLSGQFYSPIYDARNRIIGTKSYLLNDSSFGGNVPQWMIQKFAPQKIVDTVMALTKCA